MRRSVHSTATARPPPPKRSRLLCLLVTRHAKHSHTFACPLSPCSQTLCPSAFGFLLYSPTASSSCTAFLRNQGAMNERTLTVRTNDRIIRPAGIASSGRNRTSVRMRACCASRGFIATRHSTTRRAQPKLSDLPHLSLSITPSRCPSRLSSSRVAPVSSCVPRLAQVH